MMKQTKSIPKADMLELGVFYALTINPDNAHQYNQMRSDRLEWVWSYIQNYHMCKLNDNCDYILYPEISTPSCENKTGITRIHFHGKIKFTKQQGLMDWYMYFLNNLKEVSMVKIDTIEDGTYWNRYCLKNTESMKELCKLARIPYALTDETKKHRRVVKLIENVGIQQRHIKESTRI